MSRHTEDGRRVPGDPVIIGGQVTLIGGRIKPCEYGLHGSERLLDALGYAPYDKPVIGYCAFGGTIKRETDKLAARSRTVLWMLDEAESETVLRVHARWSALTVLHLWDAPDVVTRYLVTGDESLRDAARDAAWDAAWAAARAVARAAAWAAARDAAWDAAWAAARAAAWDAARDAAWAAAWDAARAVSNTELERLAWSAHNGEPVTLVVPESAREIVARVTAGGA
jgi:hypothetical protein